MGFGIRDSGSVSGFGFRVSGLGFRVSGIGGLVQAFGVSGIGIRVRGHCFGVEIPKGFGSQVSTFRDSGFENSLWDRERFSDSGFKVSGFGARNLVAGEGKDAVHPSVPKFRMSRFRDPGCGTSLRERERTRRFGCARSAGTNACDPTLKHTQIKSNRLDVPVPQGAMGAHGAMRNRGTPHSDISILLSNNQRQHRTLHIQKDVLPYALC